MDIRNTSGVTCALPAFGGWGKSWGKGWDLCLRYPHSLAKTAQARFTPIVCEAMVAFRANQPIPAA